MKRLACCISIAAVVSLAPNSVRASGNIILEAASSFLGEEPYSFTGAVSSRLGDVDEDGLDDFAIGAGSYGGDEGKVYVILGNGTGWALDQELSVEQHFIISEDSDHFGQSLLRNGGDLNGDGENELLAGGWSWNGNIYGFWGGSLVSETTHIADDYDIRLLGAGNELAIADINSDGIGDLLASCYLSNGNVYLFWGHAGVWNAELDPYSADASLSGENSGDMTSYIESSRRNSESQFPPAIVTSRG